MKEEISIDRGTIYEMYVELKNLQDMHTRHTGDIKDDIKGLWGEVSKMTDGQARIEKDLIDRIHIVERATIEKTATLAQKLAAVTIFMSLVVSVVTGVSVELIVKNLTEIKHGKHKSSLAGPGTEGAWGFRGSRLGEQPENLGVPQGDEVTSN